MGFILDFLGGKIWNAVGRRVKKFNPPEESIYFTARGIGDDYPSRRDYIHGIIDTIHTNISTLLTHISAMIAVLSIMVIIFQKSYYTTLFLFLEIAAYTLLALICVISIRWSGFVDNSEEKDMSPLYELMLRRRYMYQLCTDGLIYVTIFFFVTILSHVLLSY